MSSKRIEALRGEITKRAIDAYIIPSADAHLSEYIAEHWAAREWISGFTGSAGTVVVTADSAGLWTDSRYFLQAEIELSGSGIELFRQGIASTPKIAEFLKGKAGSRPYRVGIDESLFSINEVRSYMQAFSATNIELCVEPDLFETIWSDRPARPTGQAYELDVHFAGQSRTEKLEAVRAELTRHNTQAMVVCALDEIAWLFNLRGTDVKYNPVTVAFSLILPNETWLFVDPGKLSDELIKTLNKENIAIGDYARFAHFVKAQSPELRFLIDPARTPHKFIKHLPVETNTVEKLSPITLLKAMKNKTELEGIRNAMVRDGVSLLRFHRWLHKRIEKDDRSLTEYSIGERLFSFREQADRFVSESFGSIIGYEANGAIVHYHATAENSATIGRGMLLIDSGGQYFDGTTDITRTLHLGTPTEEQQRDYTLVLKGHIAIALARFPEGTRGSQLDILARHALWQEGLNYGHGTGHGIGHFLCVHEGPQSIRTDENPTELRPGMLLSNEPGIYRAGSHGIRIENIVAVEKKEETPFGIFLGFETLTLFPYAKNLINQELLTDREQHYIKQYHDNVLRSFEPHLTDEEKEYLMFLV